MKIRFSINQEPITGYLNIDPITKNDRVKNGVIENVDLYVDDAVCTEIVLDNYLDSVSIDEYANILEKVIKKLRIGGTIQIVATDCYEVCLKVCNGEMDPIEFNRTIHGTKSHPFLIKHGQATMNEIQKILEIFGLKIIQKEIIETTYCITAKRIN